MVKRLPPSERVLRHWCTLRMNGYYRLALFLLHVLRSRFVQRRSQHPIVAPNGYGANQRSHPNDATQGVTAARRKFVAAILAAAKTRDALAEERDRAAAARDVAAVLDELVSGIVDEKAARARDLAAQDRRAARADRDAAADDRAALRADDAADG